VRILRSSSRLRMTKNSRDIRPPPAAKHTVVTSIAPCPVQLPTKEITREDRVLRAWSVWKDDESASSSMSPLPSNHKSKMLSLSTKNRPHPLLRLPPARPRKNRGMRTKLQLYTVPGQVYYNSTRQLVLKGADGVVFVADSQESAWMRTSSRFKTSRTTSKRRGRDS